MSSVKLKISGVKTLIVSVGDAHLYYVGEEIDIRCGDGVVVRVRVVSIFANIVEFRLIGGPRESFVKAMSVISKKSYEKHTL